MPNDASKNFSGLLLDWSSRAIEKADLVACDHVRFSSSIVGTSWEKYVYESPVPLRGEDATDVTVFRYAVVCRRSGARLVLLSTGRQIVEYILEHDFATGFLPPLRKVPIAIDPLVKTITLEPTTYVLSFAHARVPAYGSNLRSASFYGDDLANAPLFKDHIDLMNFFTCGLRQATGGQEIVRLGADGSISFILTDSRRVREVEQVLHFLRVEGYLDPSSPDKSTRPQKDDFGD